MLLRELGKGMEARLVQFLKAAYSMHWMEFGSVMEESPVQSAKVWLSMLVTPSGMVMLAGGMVCAGLSILMFHGCKAATKGILILTKKFAAWLKSRWMKKEAAV